MTIRRLLLVATFAGCAFDVSAQDVQTFLYDASGRMVASTTARTGGNAAVSYYVLDDADNRVAGGTIAVSPPPTSNVLSWPYNLVPTQKLTSANGLFTLTLESSGDLVIRNSSGGLIWNSCTGQGSTTIAQVQSSGRFALLGVQLAPIWTAGTTSNPGATLTLENSGVAVLRTASGSVVWSSGTPCS